MDSLFNPSGYFRFGLVFKDFHKLFSQPLLRPTDQVSLAECLVHDGLPSLPTGGQPNPLNVHFLNVIHDNPCIAETNPVPLTSLTYRLLILSLINRTTCVPVDDPSVCVVCVFECA